MGRYGTAISSAGRGEIDISILCYQKTHPNIQADFQGKLYTDFQYEENRGSRNKYPLNQLPGGKAVFPFSKILSHTPLLKSNASV